MWEMCLLLEYFDILVIGLNNMVEFNGIFLFIVDVISWDEDLVCFVEDIGFVVVLKNEIGIFRL